MLIKWINAQVSRDALPVVGTTYFLAPNEGSFTILHEFLKSNPLTVECKSLTGLISSKFDRVDVRLLVVSQ